MKAVLESFFALALGVLVGAAVMAAWGRDPWGAYGALLQGALGNMRALTSTLSRALPLVLTGLTFAVAARAGMFNIGAQGQMLLGAVVALSCGLFPLPAGVHLVVALVLAGLAGAIWTLPVALLKLGRGVSEVISTIMLNWVAHWLTLYLVIQKLSDRVVGQRTFLAPVGMRFPPLYGELTWSWAVSVGAALFLFWFLWYHRQGYEVRAAGLNPRAARAAGISVSRAMLLALLLGGVSAAWAGAIQVLGRFPYAITSDLANLGNLGFDGIAVALIGRNHPLGILGGAFFFGVLATGAARMGLRGIPLEMIHIVQGVIVVAMAAPEA
ncbi:MAG: ABC transporter permease, partial [Candidatus Bipolaricaulaceae bacterium]